MERKDRILAYMKSSEYIPLQFSELAMVLDVPLEDIGELSDILDELVNEGKITLTKKQRYMAVDKSMHLVSGTLRCNAKGFFGFLICDDENEADVFIHGDNMENALHGDKVLVKIDFEGHENTKREGHVIKVTEAVNKNIVGVLSKRRDGTFFVYPDDTRIFKGVCVRNESLGGAVAGDRVSVEVTKLSDKGTLFGRVLVVLGKSDSLKSMIEGIILANNIKQEFDEETLHAAKNAPGEVSEKDLAGREDYRDKLIFTIDGDDARDFDDAVSLDILENGHYLLGVHIADVTHYVRESSPLDNEAFERGTSVYLADRVIPMLPVELSNGICSLNPKVDRLTLSVMMEINSKGHVIAHELKKAVICSKERMTYNKVTSILEGDEELCTEYSHLVPTIKKMEELAAILTKMRDERGAIAFDFPETKIIVDEDGNPIDIGKAERGVSNKMIEEFMLCANETIAEYAFWSEIPFVYRIHEAPSVEKLTAFNRFIRPFNMQIKGRIDNDEPIHPKALQAVLDEVKDTPEENMVALEMLHSLMKAAYSEENAGHFGLAAKYYCHFTSPIRRYPDLMIHRILKAFIDGDLVGNKYQHFTAIVPEAAAQSSERELGAEYTERDVDDLMKTAYMSNYIGETFEATVANVTNFGMFVELPNTVEGLVRVENMNGDYYVYDEENSVLRGEHSGITYKTGDPVIVVLVNTDIRARKIDFVLEQDMYPGIFRKFEKKEVSKPHKKKSSRSFKIKKSRVRNKKHG